MKTKILVDNNTYHIFKHDGIADELPVGVYEFRFGPMGQISLERQDDIIMPEKIYSNDEMFIKHVQKSFNELETGLLGIALVGGKGLGKSFTAQKIAKETNLPVIKLAGAVGSTSFSDYLKQLEQDYVLFIDEFEKIFPLSYASEDKRASQEELLSFLDNGSGRKNKIMFIITSNSAHQISDFFKNRPSRLRYFKNYEYLDEVIIKEVIDDLLVNRDHLPDLLDNLPYKDLNLDALIKIINEVNLHNSSYSSFKEFFNFQEKKDIDFTATLLLENNEKEEMGNVKHYIHPGNRLGISKKIIKGRNIPINLSYNEPTISENPLEPVKVTGMFYHPTNRDENGDFKEIEVTVVLTPNISSLSKHYVF